MLLWNELKGSEERTCIQPFDEPDFLLTIIYGSPPVSGGSSASTLRLPPVHDNNLTRTWEAVRKSLRSPLWTSE
jgi:hypothetical protein